MFYSVFLTINQWMTSGSLIGGVGSFAWGIVSVLFSPCHLASIPLIMAYIGGQKKILEVRRAGVYAAFFTAGLFTTIVILGLVGVILGQMLGDLGPYWQILPGVLLVWISLGMLGIEKLAVSANRFNKLRLSGLPGAYILGLGYGVLSGTCTFGFIAPILAVITVQKQVITGVLYISLFGIGHCLPILVAGSSAALARKLLENHAWQLTGFWFRKVAAIVILLMGIYFIARPFLETMLGGDGI